MTATRDALGRTVRQEWCRCGALDALVDANGQRTPWERDLQSRVTKDPRRRARDPRRLTSFTMLARLANMITVNMHEAKTRLSELVKAVEERNETVVLCRDGREVAEIRRRVKRRVVRNLTPDPRFRVELMSGYRPTEPLTEEEWPDTLR